MVPSNNGVSLREVLPEARAIQARDFRVKSLSADHRQIAALRIAVVAVDITAEHQPAFVGLADIEMPSAEGNNAGNHRLQALGYEGLQHMGFDRQPHPGHRCDRSRDNRSAAPRR